MHTHLSHLSTSLPLLEKRADMLKHIRTFFWDAKFQEVETPLLLRLPGQEPYLSPVPVTIHNDKGVPHHGFLHTSPEYTMKKLLAAGAGNIFFLGKTFRDYESFGGSHNPEFTMLEWYRVEADMFDLMKDVEQLCKKLQETVQNNELGIKNKEFVFQKISMKELWAQTIDVNLDEYLTQSAMLELCRERGYKVSADESYEDLFYRIFLNEIEPTFCNQKSAIIIHHYPAPMAALAKLSESDAGYAERFEVYMGGMEIANAFSELTDSEEQWKRLQQEQALRKKLGKTVYDIDMDFVEAVGKLPSCAGIALGVDRLIQILVGTKHIDDVLVLPASRLFP